jgi:DNA-binding NarL/FixJ family response regulator
MADLRIFILADDPLVRAGLALLLERQAGIIVAGGEPAFTERLAQNPLPSREEVFRYDAILWDLGADPEKGLEILRQARKDLDFSEMGPVVWLAPEVAGLGLELISSLLETSPANHHQDLPERGPTGRGIIRREASAGMMVQALQAVTAGLNVWEGELKGERRKDKGEGYSPFFQDLQQGAKALRGEDGEQAESKIAGNSRGEYQRGTNAFDTAVVETGETLTPREAEVLRLVADGLPNKVIAGRLGISEHTVKFHLNTILGKLQASSRTEAVTRAARLGWIIL